jgi:LysM repeat protein
MHSPPAVAENRIGESAQAHGRPDPAQRPIAEPQDPTKPPPGHIIVRPGETLSYISVLYGVSEKDLMIWNGLSPTSEVHAGQRLAVAPPQAHSAPSARTDNAPASVPQTAPAPSPLAPSTPAPPQPDSNGMIVVASGQSLSVIAARYGATTAQLREWNGLKNNNITAGKRLRVQPPVAKSSGSLGAPAAAAPQPARRESKRAATPPGPAAPDASGMITVQSGQNLSGIAVKYGVSAADLRQWNKLKSEQLKTGQKLRVRAPVRTHTVKAGESLNGIAAKYKVSAQAIMQKNKLSNADRPPAGKALIIP